jgi:hypothetical protein
MLLHEHRTVSELLADRLDEVVRKLWPVPEGDPEAAEAPLERPAPFDQPLRSPAGWACERHGVVTSRHAATTRPHLSAGSNTSAQPAHLSSVLLSPVSKTLRPMAISMPFVRSSRKRSFAPLTTARLHRPPGLCPGRVLRTQSLASASMTVSRTIHSPMRSPSCDASALPTSMSTMVCDESLTACLFFFR